MSILNEYIACPAIQEALIGNFGQLSNDYRESVPFTEFIMSTMNTSGVLQSQINRGNGHKGIVEVIYRQRLLTSGALDDVDFDCTGGDARGELSETFEIDPAVGTMDKWSITLSDLIERCEDDSTYFARELQAHIDRVVRRINEKNITQAYAARGKFATSGATTAIAIATKDADGRYVADAIEEVIFQNRENEYYGTPILFSGAKEFSNYFSYHKYAVPNTFLGADVAAATQQVLPIYDRYVETGAGAGLILNVAPGALQLLTYNRFLGPKGIRMIDQDTVKQGVITDPKSGITFDYYAEYSCGSWNFQLGVAHVLKAMPTDMFAVGDRMSGVNWVNVFDITNP